HDTMASTRCIQASAVSYTTSYNSVLNNIITACGGVGTNVAQGLLVEGDHWLIDGNIFSHVEDGMALYCQYCVVRNNHIGPLAVSDYPSSNHPDGLESSCSSSDTPLQHLLYENNVLQEWRGPNAHGFLLRDTASPHCGLANDIFRLSAHIDSGSYFSVTQTSALSMYFYNLSISNTEIDFTPYKDASDFAFQDGSTTGRAINNLFTNETWPNNVDWCIYDDATSTGMVENHNLCFMTG